MRIAPGEKICGVDALSLRKAFRFVSNLDDFSTELLAEKLGLSKKRGPSLLNDLAAEGFVTPHLDFHKRACWRLTKRGRALALASAAKPLTRATADRLVEEFLARAMAINTNGELAYVVTDAVLFGSYLTDARRLNDVDIGFRLARRNPAANAVEENNHRVSVARKRGRQFRSWFDELNWPRTEVLLLMKARSRGLSLHDMDNDAIFTEKLTTSTRIRDSKCVEL